MGRKNEDFTDNFNKSSFNRMVLMKTRLEWDSGVHGKNKEDGEIILSRSLNWKGRRKKKRILTTVA